MKKYEVWLKVSASKYLGEVEAENDEDALEKAEEAFDCDEPRLCYQCSNAVEINGADIQVEPAHSGEDGETK